jgi:hypothetical protein
MELRELHELDATDPEDWGLIDYSQQAARLLEGFYGVQEIRRIRLAFGVARVIGLFLAEVVSRHGTEDTVWVIVGDLPPSASHYREDETPRAALELYAALSSPGAPASSAPPAEVSFSARAMYARNAPMSGCGRGIATS